jgi:hypothetical protein
MSEQDVALESALEGKQPDTNKGLMSGSNPPVEEPSVEAPKEEAAKTEEDKKFAAKFAALARKEKAQRIKDQQLAAKEKQLEDRIKELEDKLNAKPAEAPKKSLEDRLFENPFEALAEAGLDYENLTKTALNDGKLPVEIQMKRMQIQMQRDFDAKLEAIQKSLSEKEEMTKKEREEAAKKQEETQQSEILGNFKRSIAEMVDQKKEDLQLIAQEGEYGVDLIYSEIAADAQRQKEELGEGFEDEIKIMSIEEAASKVEERLLNKARDYTKLSKIQGLFAAPKADEKSTNKKQENAPTTLSNRQSQVQGPVKRHQSEEELLREAARMLKFNT